MIVVHPNQPQLVLAGVGSGAPGLLGVYRSTDAGNTWQAVLTGGAGSDIVLDPSAPDIMYAAIGSSGGGSRNGIYKSTDAGITWTQLSGTGGDVLPTKNVGRISLAIAPSNTQVLYAAIQDTSIANFGMLLGTYKSVDGGQSWTQLTMPNFCSTQCWYDLVLRVNPANPDIVYAGGISLWGTIDGGATWRPINGNFTPLHVDHHALAFSADGSRLYDGDDGGVWMTTDVTGFPNTWNNLNSSFAIAQFSPGFSINPTDANIAYAGTQDNSTMRYSGRLAWDEVACGDGGWTVIDPSSPTQAFTSCQNISLLKSLPQGGWVSILSGINQADPHQFYAPFIGDPSDGLRLYFGSNHVYQTNDGGGSWSAISPDITNNRTITTIAVAPSDPNVVYAGTSNGLVQVTTNATQSGGADWSNRSTGLPIRVVTQIAVHSSDPMTAYVTYSGFPGAIPGHVFKTTNGGISWANISGDLPNIPANDIVIDPDAPGTLYLATDVGVFRSIDDGGSWATLSNGLPRVVVTGLKLHRASRTLRAGTHGRSMWDLAVPLSAPALIPAITSLSPGNADAGHSDFQMTITGVNFVSGSIARWNGDPRSTTFVDSTHLTVSVPASDVAASGRSSITVLNPAGFGASSNVVNFDIGPAPAIPANGIVSAANSLAGPVAPGGIVSIYGSNLASGTIVASGGTLPFTLGNASMTMNTALVPFFFVSPGQVNVQVPWGIGGATATIHHSVGNFTSPPVSVSLATVAPALFATNSRGTGQGSILIAGTAFIAAPDGAFPGSRPAQHGEFIEIYCTGLGAVKSVVLTGAPAPGNPPVETRATPTVMIGGVSAEVTFSGLTPGAVGLYQVDLKIPDTAPTGDAISVELAINGIKGNTVTMAIQ
jgi:uncharacterized protein (TIGR03437 family)